MSGYSAVGCLAAVGGEWEADDGDGQMAQHDDCSRGICVMFVWVYFREKVKMA